MQFIASDMPLEACQIGRTFCQILLKAAPALCHGYSRRHSFLGEVAAIPSEETARGPDL